MSELPVLRPEWPAPPQVRAAVTLRAGGVSRAPFDTLNIATHTGDALEAVAENRRRVRSALALPAEPAWLAQEHGAEVVDLDRYVRELRSGMNSAQERDAKVGRLDGDRDGGPLPAGGVAGEPFRADGAVTRSPGRICVIQVADCMPVLFAARDGTAVGAAHAGWRGLAAGVLEATVRALGADPANLLAWLGPAIGQSHFEVGEDVRTALASRDPRVDSAFVRNARGRWQCDLYAVARARLRGLGVGEVYGGGWDTFADAARFFSYRRDGRCGRMAALVWIEGEGRVTPSDALSS